MNNLQYIIILETLTWIIDLLADSGVYHLENAGPWNEKHLNVLSLRERISNPKHGLRYIYPNRPIKNTACSKFPEGVLELNCNY